MYFPLRKYMTGPRLASLPEQRPPGTDDVVTEADVARGFTVPSIAGVSRVKWSHRVAHQAEPDMMGLIVPSFT
jgi:hypothetical protein